MIEINLLPPEFRPKEGTNMPLMITVVVGVLIVGGIILYGIRENETLAGLQSDHQQLSQDKQTLQDRVKTVNDLKTKIAQQESRLQIIMSISQSKIMWSQKLQQLSQIMSAEEFKGFWVKRVELRPPGAKQTLTLKCSAVYRDTDRHASSERYGASAVALFRKRLKRDPNFFYHFSDLQSRQTSFKELGTGLNYTHSADFTLTLPLKKAPDGKKRKKK